MPEPVSLSPRRIRRLADQLVAWYREHRRDLPWRRTRDPYAIWISEIMLQQTRVEAVIPRYESFLRRFPDLESLAAARQSDVLAEWAGLGYYRRARSLHAAAQRIREDGGGKLPSRFAALMLLPGLGRYTAGAVASIAHEEAVPAVDGNVERVLTRLLALEDDPKRGSGQAVIEATARALVKAAQPSELNQALMELGALLCTPRSPACARCPWTRACRARSDADPERFPRKLPRRATVAVSCYAAVHRSGDALLYRRRGEESHNAGLWELPTTVWHGGAPLAERAAAELPLLGAELGARWEVGEALTSVSHGITHHRIKVVAHVVDGPITASPMLRWASAEDANALGLTAATRKLVARLPRLL